MIDEVITTELATVQPTVQLGILRADSPAGFVQSAAGLATALADLIRERKLFSNIQGKEFVKVEGWTTLAAMLGVTPREVAVTEMPEGVFTAVVELCRVADGAVVGRASAECGSPEEVDRSGRPLWANRSRNARRSMALTRATGKACRLAFSWVMTLAGYEATPAEEMGDDHPRHDASQDREAGRREPPPPPPRRVSAEEIQTLKSEIQRTGRDLEQFLVWAGKRQHHKGNDSPLDYITEVGVDTFRAAMDMMRRAT